MKNKKNQMKWQFWCVVSRKWKKKDIVVCMCSEVFWQWHMYGSRYMSVQPYFIRSLLTKVETMEFYTLEFWHMSFFFFIFFNWIELMFKNFVTSTAILLRRKYLMKVIYFIDKLIFFIFILKINLFTMRKERFALA